MPVELTDAEVFAPRRELSDREVFGSKELSDAEVFSGVTSASKARDLFTWETGQPAHSSEELGAKNAAAINELRKVFPGYAQGTGPDIAVLARPLVNLVQRFDAKQIADAIDVLSTPERVGRKNEEFEDPLTAALDEERQQNLAEPSRTPTSAEKVAAGVGNVVGKGVNTFTSPIGIATLGQGALPTIGQRLVSGLFAADMARATPELAREAGKASVTGDIGEQVEAIGDLLLNTAMVATAGKHAITPEKVVLSRRLASELVRAEMAPPEVKLAEASHLPVTAKTIEELRDVDVFGKEAIPSAKEEGKEVLTEPGAPPSAPVPETSDSISKQLEVTLDPQSTKAVTLITPDSPLPPLRDGLERVPVGQHGTADFNPAKTTREAVLAAAEGKDFDGTLLGMSQPVKPEPVGNTVVQTKKDGVTVLDEVVAPTPEAIATATEAHKAAVPGGETTIKPAEAVIAERTEPVQPAKNAPTPEAQSAVPAGKPVTESAAPVARWRSEALSEELTRSVQRGTITMADKIVIQDGGNWPRNLGDREQYEAITRNVYVKDMERMLRDMLSKAAQSPATREINAMLARVREENPSEDEYVRALDVAVERAKASGLALGAQVASDRGRSIISPEQISPEAASFPTSAIAEKRGAPAETKTPETLSESGRVVGSNAKESPQPRETKGELKIAKVQDELRRWMKGKSAIGKMDSDAKREWLKEFGIPSHETNRRLRYTYELSDGRIVSADGALKITNPKAYDRIKEKYNNLAVAKARAEVFKALPEDVRKQIVDDLPYDEIARLDTDHYSALNKYLRREGHLLADVWASVGEDVKLTMSGRVADIQSAMQSKFTDKASSEANWRKVNIGDNGSELVTLERDGKFFTTRANSDKANTLKQAGWKDSNDNTGRTANGESAATAEVPRTATVRGVEGSEAADNNAPTYKGTSAKAVKPESPAHATEKMQEQVSTVAKTEGARPAKEIKSELIQRLEEALEKAPEQAPLTGEYRQAKADLDYVGKLTNEKKKWSIASLDPVERGEVRAIAVRYQHGNDSLAGLYNAINSKLSKVPPTSKEYITIKIPGDGDFKIINSKPSIEQVLKDAKKLSVSKGGIGVSRTGSKGTIEQAVDYAKRVYGSADEAYRRVKAQYETVEDKSEFPDTPELIEKLLTQTSAGKANIAAKQAQYKADTYRRQIEKEIQPEIDRTDRLKKQTKKHEESKAYWQKRLADAMELRNSAQAEADKLGQEAARLNAALEAKPESSVASAEEKQVPQSMGGQNPADTGELMKSQLAQLTDAVRSLAESGSRTEPAKAFELGESMARTKESIQAALDGLTAAGAYLKARLEGKPVVTNWQRLLGDRHLALTESAVNARIWMKKVLKAIPDPKIREAISNWVDTGGDAALLERAANETKPNYRAGYDKALHLTHDEVTVAENLRNYFESRLQEAIDAGILEDGIENYLHRIYEQDSSWKRGVVAELRSGIFTGKPALAKQRVFEYDFEAEKAGKRPIKDFAKRVVAYDLALNKAIADRAAVKAMMELRMPDGRPMIDVGGGGKLIPGPNGGTDATFINRSSKNMDESEPKTFRGDFKTYDHPALRKWKWVAEDAEGKPIFVQGDVLVHPEAMKQIKVLFDRSAIRQNPVGKLALDLSSMVKQTMLDLSGFHQVQIAVHGMEHKTFKPVKEIDFTNPDVRGLIRGGAAVGETTGLELFSEGLSGSSLTRHIPWVGERVQAYQHWLFGEYIPKLKVAMGLHALERNRERFPKLSDEELYQMTANQMNAAFGELNYTMMGRSKTMQDALRLMLLAPDFLEARSRFVAQAFTKMGSEQRNALILGAVTMYITARIINKLLNDEYHWELKNAFNVVYNGRSYGLRTVQGDLIHAVTDTGKFANHRLNPVYAKPALEFLTGRDYFGRERDAAAKLKDLATTIVPISMRGPFTGQEQTLLESFLNAFGFVVKRDSPSSDMTELAKQWRRDNKVKSEPGEFIYDADKDPYRKIKLAAERGDEGAVRTEIGEAIKAGLKRSDISKHFALSEKHYFAGSPKNERKFVESLNADQRKIYDDAREERKRIKALVLKALR